MDIKSSKIKKKDIIVNYTCYCNKFFYCNEEILYILPCCHIVHLTCFNKYLLDVQYSKLNNQNSIDKYIKCPECKVNITKVLTERRILLKDKYKQEKIDIKSIRLPHNSNINYITLPINLIKCNSIINKIIDELFKIHQKILDSKNRTEKLELGSKRKELFNRL